MTSLYVSKVKSCTKFSTVTTDAKSLCLFCRGLTLLSVSLSLSSNSLASDMIQFVFGGETSESKSPKGL